MISSRSRASVRRAATPSSEGGSVRISSQAWDDKKIRKLFNLTPVEFVAVSPGVLIVLAEGFGEVVVTVERGRAQKKI